MKLTRREWLAGAGLAAAGSLVPTIVQASDTKPGSGSCPFRLAVINDEITQDFERACQIVAHDFGLQWIELRAMWNKNVTELNAKEIAERRRSWRRTSCG